MTDVRWKDTPEETETRVALRVQPDDFVRLDVGPQRQQSLYAYELSDRIGNGLPINDTVKQRLRTNLTPVAEDIGNTLRMPFYPLESINIRFQRELEGEEPYDTYRITIRDTLQNRKLLVIEIPPWNLIDIRPAVIESIKEAVANVGLGEARKKFVSEKTATRVGQAIGINDPLAAKKEIGSFLGGRRRKSRKSKKTSKKTLRQSNGRRR